MLMSSSDFFKLKLLCQCHLKRIHFGNYREKMRVAGEQDICIKHITDDGTRRPVRSGLSEEMSSWCNSNI